MTGWQQKVLDFWFKQMDRENWFKPGGETDRQIRDEFADLHSKLSSEIPTQCLYDARSALAAIIVLDQFSRNMFRGTEKAFAFDQVALALARNGLTQQFDAVLSEEEKVFLYLPFMHAEDLAAQQESVRLFLKFEGNLGFALEHHDIIARFGRFPHRNQALGRETTPAEARFMETHKGF
ncbi:DUF924 family protein [Limoniibacter endophyticus]|nr:DUF924 family protein [Limoniibacter endophyticus]